MNQSCAVTTTSILLFLQRIAFDDHYRNRLLDNPKAVLAEQGIDLAHGIETVKLPSKSFVQILLSNIASETDSDFEPAPAPPSYLFNLFIFRAPTSKAQQYSRAI